MRIEEVVGRNLAHARAAKGWTQEQFGYALAEHLGTRWSRQAVSSAEKGGRAFTAVELLALSLSLERPVAWFFLPDGVDTEIDLPTGRSMPAPEVLDRFRLGARAGDVEGFVDLAARFDVIRQLSADQMRPLAHIREWVDLLAEGLQLLTEMSEIQTETAELKASSVLARRREGDAE